MMALVAANPAVSLADNPVENDRTAEPAADEDDSQVMDLTLSQPDA